MNKGIWQKVLLSLFWIIALAFPVVFLIIVIITLSMMIPVFAERSIYELLFGTEWLPSSGIIGLFPFIMGTIWVTGISLLIAVPTGLLCMIYLAEFASVTVQKIIKPFFDLLAGIPSVLFGLFGILVIVPITRDFLAPLAGVQTTGYCVLSGAFILGFMILPTLVSLGVEVFRAVPTEMKNASLILGATRLETFWYVTLIKSFPGLIGVILLAFSRAAGETMAVLMVVGNVVQVPHSIWDSAYPLPALIANNYGELMSVPSLQAAIMAAAFILILLIVVVHILFRAFLSQVHQVVM
jgi:phosphate transport system permease protein